MEELKFEVPVVIGQKEFQILEENITTLKGSARTIVDKTLDLKSITCEIIKDKVIIQGTAIKTIVYKSTKSNKARVITENVTFSTIVEIPGAEPGMHCQLENLRLEPAAELLTTCKIREKIIVSGKVVVTKLRQAELEPVFKPPKKDHGPKDKKDHNKKDQDKKDKDKDKDKKDDHKKDQDKKDDSRDD